jgi:hypothetical protein
MKARLDSAWGAEFRGIDPELPVAETGVLGLPEGRALPNSGQVGWAEAATLPAPASQGGLAGLLGKWRASALIADPSRFLAKLNPSVYLLSCEALLQPYQGPTHLFIEALDASRCEALIEMHDLGGLRNQPGGRVSFFSPPRCRVKLERQADIVQDGLTMLEYATLPDEPVAMTLRFAYAPTRDALELAGAEAQHGQRTAIYVRPQGAPYDPSWQLHRNRR